MRMSDRKLEEARWFLTRRFQDKNNKVLEERRKEIDEEWSKTGAGKEEKKIRERIAKLEEEKKKEYEKLRELTAEREEKKSKSAEWYKNIAEEFHKGMEEKLVMIGLGADAQKVMEELINEINNLK